MGKIGKYSSVLPAQAIPARIVIGVTGHRKLNNEPALTNAIRSAIDSIRQMVPPLRNTPLLLCVLSPLAEGADRLVAREVLKIPEAVLEVVLPLEKNDYMADFETEESRKEFATLLSQAKSVRTLSSRGSRTEAYEKAGRDVVDQCDVLITLWDGKASAGKGGTQEIVHYAIDNRCPLIWIHAENPAQIEVKKGRGLDPKPFRDLDEYNSECVNSVKFETRLKQEVTFFMAQAERAKLPSDRLRATVEYILRHYVRGDILALYYQHLYYRAESLVYSLASAAVIIAAFQILFVPDRPVILISEIILMLAVLSIVWVGHRQRWHNKWIDYRFLAERFRSALFMAVANMDVSMLRPPRHLSLAYSPKDWKVIAFISVWSQRPRWQTSGSLVLEEVRHFLCEGWVEDQILYHDSIHKRHHRRHQRMALASYVLFGLTICVALLHVLDIGSHFLETVFAFMAVIFPAVAASITAIRTHRDYLRNSMRSEEMARHLKELKGKMDKAQDLAEFFTLVKETEETMLHENEDWRVVMRFHSIEPA